MQRDLGPRDWLLMTGQTADECSRLDTPGGGRPRVSVIIPFYGSTDWLDAAVMSVLQQTFRDFEVIVVDDGSPDGIRPDVGLPDRRVRRVLQEHKGVSAARNLGIDLAAGVYVAFLDADDVFLPSKLEEQVAVMEANPDLLWTHTSYQRVDEKGAFIETVRSGDYSGRVYPERIIRDCPIITSTVVVRRRAFNKDIRFVESVEIGEDTILWARLARICPASGIDKVLTSYRVRGNNSYLNSAKQIAGSKSIVDHLIRNNPNLNLRLRTRLLSEKYRRIAYLHLALGDRTQFLAWFGRAVVAWPWNARAYRDFLLRAVASLLARLGLLEHVRRWRRR